MPPMPEWSRHAIQDETEAAVRPGVAAPSRRKPWVWLVLGAVLLGIVGGVVHWLRNAAQRRAVVPAPVVLHFPVTCRANQSLTIQGRTHLGSGTLIRVEPNCRLRIEDSRLSADRVIDARGGQIQITRSVLSGRDIALYAQDGLELTARESEFSGNAAAVSAGSEARVSLEGARLRGQADAMTAGSNLRLIIRHVEMAGRDYGLRTAANLNLDARDSKLSGARAALSSESSLRATLARSALSGEDTALRAGLDAVLELASGSTLQGKTAALTADANVRLTLRASRAEASARAIDAELNAKIELYAESVVRADKIGIAATGNLDLLLDHASLHGDVVAVCSTFNTRIEARDSTLSGADALRLQKAPAHLLLERSRVTGARVFDARDCKTETEVAAAAGDPSLIGSAGPSAPAPNGAPGVSFDYPSAIRELDRATRMAGAVCHASRNSSRMVVVDPGFTPDGTNQLARVRNAGEVGGAAECVLYYFRRIRIPPYNPSEKPTNMFRVVGLKE